MTDKLIDRFSIHRDSVAGERYWQVFEMNRIVLNSKSYVECLIYIGARCIGENHDTAIYQSNLIKSHPIGQKDGE